jgi:hypothetical protein
LKVPSQYVGKSVKCPQCGEPIRVAAPTRSKSSANANAGLDDLFDEVDLGVSKTGRRCPNCRTDLQSDGVICVKCGFHTETGKQLKTKKTQAVATDAQSAVLAAAKAAPPTELPAPIKTLAKLLNQVGMLGVLAALGFFVFQCYQVFSTSAAFGVDQLIEVAMGTSGYLFGAVILLLAVPSSVAANLVQEGKPAGRILSMVVGFVGLLGLITTLPAILVLKLAFSDEVTRHCR